MDYGMPLLVNAVGVVVKDEVIYGDGVNVAARLESLAEPGRICVSLSAYDQVKNKLKVEYELLGKKEVNHIAEPVPVYRVRSEPEAGGDGFAGLELGFRAAALAFDHHRAFHAQ